HVWDDEQLAQLLAGSAQQALGLGPQELADLIAEPTLDLADLAEHPIDLLARGLAALLELLDRVARELARVDHRGEALGRDRLAVDRREDQRLRDPAGLADHQRESGRGQLGLERLGAGVDLGHGLLLDLLAAAADQLAGQRGRELADDELPQLAELLAKQLAAPALDRDQLGPIGVVEVVDVEVIGRGGGLRTDLLEQLADRGQSTGALEPADVDVLAGRVDLQAEAQRVDGLVLADD